MFNRLLPLLRGCQQTCSMTTTSAAALCLLPRLVVRQVPFCYSAVISAPAKKKHRQKQTVVDDDDEDSDEDEDETKPDDIDDGLPRDYRVMKLKMEGIRLDSVIKRTLNLNTDDTEKKIVQGLVRLNEKVVTRKALKLYEDDEVEVWLDKFPENNELAFVHRVKLASYTFREDKLDYEVLVYVWKRYITDNWVEI